MLHIQKVFMEFHYVYLLQSSNFERFYVGYTTDLKRRLREHNEGKLPNTARYPSANTCSISVHRLLSKEHLEVTPILLTIIWVLLCLR